MYHHIFRHFWSGRVFGRVLRGLGSAALAGFGWKLGSDVYKRMKKESDRPADTEKQGSEDSGQT